MKTNFEAWRDSLTPDDDVVMFGLAGIICKKKCPAAQYCMTKRKNEPYVSPFKNGWNCKRVFTTWANFPAKERSEVEAIADQEAR